ncbi:(R)-mandelonitrile lyase [Burkholderia sp. WSM2232]|uniref:(R)-mandelonitrile lyase n=1 Tax=Burkholderia sp. WSM2232 TaxID=944436 RepID=UPI0018DBE600|nr:cupin domain-containing protein [Burkholderia sp. WSM2232]
MTVAHSGAQPSVSGDTQRFAGQVRIDPLFQSNAPSRLSGGLVTFEPGARTAWHTHPLGQTLLITSGRGWVQQWGHEKHEVLAGDVVSIPPGVRHWHGATSTTGMTHVALQEALDGKNVNWLEQVTDEQYRQP